MSNLRIDNIAPSAGGTYRNAPRGIAAAWVNFNGTGTVAIRDSENVGSITDNGTGDYTINFTNSLADSNYAMFGMVESVSATDTRDNINIKGVQGTSVSNKTTTSVTVITGVTHLTGVDNMINCNVSIMGDLA
jgi:hypothetical protein